MRPKQDKQALPCAGRVSADTVAGSYHPETGGRGSRAAAKGFCLLDSSGVERSVLG